MHNLPDDNARTPCLLLDVERMTRNLGVIGKRLAALGVPLRPHVKTCKSVEIARRMLGPASPGIAVSTLAEAEHFFEHGFADLLYAVGIAPGKLPAAARLAARGARLTIALDRPETARIVADESRRLGHRFDVVLEIDADGARAGVAPDDDALPRAADILASSGCRVLGVMTHMGGSYACRDRDCIVRAAERERCAAVTAAARLREAGFEAPMVGVGSTPTARFAAGLDGVTEVRAGVHVFMDLVMAGLGVCRVDDIAISVLTEVIGYRADPGEWLIDAGWMALSRDRGTADQAVDQGYGLVCDADGRPLDDVVVRATSQEHGIVARRDGRPLPRDAFGIGQRLRILPNHACATAAQFDGYLPVAGADADAWWPRMRGW